MKNCQDLIHGKIIVNAWGEKKMQKRQQKQKQEKNKFGKTANIKTFWAIGCEGRNKFECGRHGSIVEGYPSPKFVETISQTSFAESRFYLLAIIHEIHEEIENSFGFVQHRIHLDAKRKKKHFLP